MSEAFRNNNGDGDRKRESTSPGDLSSPPKSPDSPIPHRQTAVASHNTSTVAYPHLPSRDVIKDGGEKASVVSAVGKTKAAVPRKYIRKKKEESSNSNNSSTATETKEKKTRRTRGPNKPKFLPSQKPNDNPPTAVVTKQETPDPSLTGFGAQGDVRYVPFPDYNRPPSYSQSGNHEAIPAHSPSVTHAFTPRSTGQNYDPIRSATVDASNMTPNTMNTPQLSPLKSANRASASPSISSLIDPPNAPTPQSYPFPKSATISSPTTSFRPPPLSQPPPLLHTSPLMAVNPLANPPPVNESSAPALSKPDQIFSAPMDIDTEPVCLPSTKPASLLKKSTGTSTGSSSTAPSPKPGRVSKESVPLPSLPPLFGGPSESSSLERSAPTVILHVPLNGEINKYVNFARLAEERYGFEALHPRLAAQRERLARVAAAGAALENAGKSVSTGTNQSTDDLSENLSDGDGDASNVEMGGTGATGGSGTEEGKKTQPTRKRRMKEDQYDKDDPFVDDSEMAWEEQAAASKDGFFVYSGPLVPEGEKPTVERYVFVSYIMWPSSINLFLFILIPLLRRHCYYRSRLFCTSFRHLIYS